MERIQISCDEFQQALAWINGQASTLGEREVLRMLRTLTDAFRENCRTLRPGPVPRFRGLTLVPNPLSLSSLAEEAGVEGPLPLTPPEILKEVGETLPPPFETGEKKPETTPGEERPDDAAPAGTDGPSLDSVLLINSIAHVGATAGYPLTQSRAQIILYCLYGTRLASGKGRLEIEHPQMWKYGPVFPRAYKRGCIEDAGACAESYRELMETRPALLTVLSTKTQAMMATPMADLNAVHKGAQSPYGKLLSKYPEKWGTQIPDEAIAEFFRKAGRQYSIK